MKCLLLLCGLLLAGAADAQPGSGHKFVPVGCIRADGEPLYVSKKSHRGWASVYRLTKEPRKEKCFLTTTDGTEKGWYTLLIYKRDTMKLTPVYAECCDPFRLRIDTLHFRKGQYTIDMEACATARNSGDIEITLRAFPEDCAGYQIKE